MPQNEILAIIPARGGSKGIPRKNIRDFAGYPLIAWSIAAARQSKLVTRTIVSSDDEEIAAVARLYGAEVPFMRPAELAQDQTTDFPVFEHALRWLEEHENYRPEVVIQLRPTSPIRPIHCVDEGVEILLSHPDANCVRGVVPAGQNPHKMWRLPAGENAPMKNLLEVEGVAEPYNAPRQNLPPVYWQTGHLDVIRTTTILEKKSMSGGRIFPLVIDSRYTVDLDNLSDWVRYEWLAVNGGMEMVWPGVKHRPMPKEVKLLILDFDGVLTDNRVWVDQEGGEMVAANRSDSFGINLLKEAGVETLVISKETNPVVAARCRKMEIPCFQGEDDKASVLKSILQNQRIDSDKVIYCGNDVNDLPCFPLVGWAAVVADSLPEVSRNADFVLSKHGGHGAVRELCDLILKTRDAK